MIKTVRNFYRKIIIIMFVIFFSGCFWLLKDFTSVIYTDFNYGYSDLSRYYFWYYQKISFFEIFQSKGPIYQAIIIFFQNIGINFEFFLFIIIFIYYYAFIIIYYSATKEKNLLIYFLLLVFLSFWMQSYIGVILRQGVAFIFLFFFLFRKCSINFFQKLIIILLASGIHSIMIVALPLILLEKFLIKKIKLIEYFFVIILILYFFNFFSLLSETIHDIANLFKINLEALQINNSNFHYQTGFSVYKGLAILVPFVLFKFSIFLKGNLNILKARIYLYFIYFSTLGISASGLMYHDRVMSLSWITTPILICFSIRPILNFLQKV